MLDNTFYYELGCAMRPIFMTVVDNDSKLYRHVKKSFQARTLDMTSIAMDIIEFDPVKVGFTHKPGITVRNILDSVARHCDAGDEPGVTQSYYIPGEDDEGAYDFYYTEADWEYDPGLLDLLTLDLHMPFSEDSGKLRARLNREAVYERYGDTLFTEIDNVISLTEDEIAPRYRISCKHRQEHGQHILDHITLDFHATDTAGKTTQEQIDAYRSAGGALALGWWNNPELSLGIADLPPEPEPTQVIMEPGDAGEVLEIDSEVVYAPAERPRLADEVFWDIESLLLGRYGLSMSDIEFYYSY